MNGVCVELLHSLKSFYDLFHKKNFNFASLYSRGEESDFLGGGGEGGGGGGGQRDS